MWAPQESIHWHRRFCSLPLIYPVPNFQANRLSFGILLSHFVFLLVPSLVVGVVDSILGLPVFKTIGPFYIAFLFLAGAFNPLVYATQHLGLKSATRTLFGREMPMKTTTVVPSTISMIKVES
jgi:hypothetical protein